MLVIMALVTTISTTPLLNLLPLESGKIGGGTGHGLTLRTKIAALHSALILSLTRNHPKAENMTSDNMKEEIRQYILSEFLPGEKPANLRDDTPLRTSGVLDSVATLRLVTFVEEQFGITVEAHEASVENFDSIDNIAAFVQSKQNGAS